MLNKVLTAQPQYPARINGSNPITRGLAAVVSPIGWMGAPISGAVLPVSATPYGMASVLSGSGKGASYSGTFTAYPLTIFRLGRVAVSSTSAIYSGVNDSVSSGSKKAFFNSGESGQYNRFWIRTASAQSVRVYSAYKSIADGRWAATTGVFRAYNDIDVYWNGEKDNGTLTTGDNANTTFNRIAAFSPDTSTTNSTDTSVALLLVWNRALSDSEVASISANPWQIYEAPQDFWWFGVSSGGTTVSGALGTASGVGYQATVSQATSIAGTLGTATASGYNAAVITGTQINAGFAQATALGYQASVAQSTAITGALGTAAASGFTASVAQATAITGALGTATASGYQASVSSGGTVACGLGTASAVGYSASVAATTAITCSPGTATASGYQAQVAQGSVVGCSIGTASGVGYQASISAATLIACGLGTALAFGYPANMFSALRRNTRYTMPDRARTFTASNRARTFTASNRARNFWTGMT